MTIWDTLKQNLETGVPINVTVDNKVFIKLAVTAVLVTIMIVLILIIYRRFK